MGTNLSLVELIQDPVPVYWKPRAQAIMFVIALIGTLLALAQNIVMLAFGAKEGAIWFAPLSFGHFSCGNRLAMGGVYLRP